MLADITLLLGRNAISCRNGNWRIIRDIKTLEIGCDIEWTSDNVSIARNIKGRVLGRECCHRLLNIECVVDAINRNLVTFALERE